MVKMTQFRNHMKPLLVAAAALYVTLAGGAIPAVAELSLSPQDPGGLDAALDTATQQALREVGPVVARPEPEPWADGDPWADAVGEGRQTATPRAHLSPYQN